MIEKLFTFMCAQFHLQGEIWSQKKQIPQSSKAFRLDSTVSGEPSASACTTCKDCFLSGGGGGGGALHLFLAAANAGSAHFNSNSNFQAVTN